MKNLLLSIVFFLLGGTLSNASFPNFFRSKEEFIQNYMPPTMSVTSGNDVVGTNSLYGIYYQEAEEAYQLCLKRAFEAIQSVQSVKPPPPCKHVRDIKVSVEKDRPLKRKRISKRTIGLMKDKHIDFLGHILMTAHHEKKSVIISQVHKIFQDEFGLIPLSTFSPWLYKAQYSRGLSCTIKKRRQQIVTPKMELFLYNYVLDHDIEPRLISQYLAEEFSNPSLERNKVVSNYIRNMKFGKVWQERHRH